MMRLSAMILLVIASAFCPVECFQTALPAAKPSQALLSTLSMAPKYDPETEKWSPTTPEDEEGYPVFGTLLRQGPKPFFQRLSSGDDYEQAVYKYMAKEECSRNEAQGNMDAYFENPNDWQYQKLQEKDGAEKFDYANANMDPKQLVLTAIWSVVVTYFLSDIAQFIYKAGLEKGLY
eukprot:scaffold22073_cov47-Attheya_sp.AAC.2